MSKCTAPFESAKSSSLYASHGHTCARKPGHKDQRHVCQCGASSINLGHAKRKDDDQRHARELGGSPYALDRV